MSLPAGVAFAETKLAACPFCREPAYILKCNSGGYTLGCLTKFSVKESYTHERFLMPCRGYHGAFTAYRKDDVDEAVAKWNLCNNKEQT